jgi:dienelactone hydrolase
MNKYRLALCIHVFIAACSITGYQSAAAQTTPSTANDLQAEIIKVTVKGAGLFGDADMPVHVFKPTLTQANAGSGPWPVVIFSHGRAGSQFERAQLKNPVAFGHVRYWHSKGYAVIAPIRPGYGGSAGDPENSGASFPVSGGACTGSPSFARTAQAASHAVRAAHDWLLTQEWAQKKSILLVGQSVGGLTTLAACSQAWPGVIGCINFAGGAGGNPSNSPGKSCAPEKMGDLMAEFGRTTPLPSLWLYSENDLYWGAEAPKQWHKAHVDAATAAGRKQTAEFFAAPPVEPDGHRLLLIGGRFWSPPLNAWLKKNGF